MRGLIEKGKVFVAQPPLFKVSKRRKEEYIFDERLLQERLQHLGAASVTLEVGGNGHALRPSASPPPISGERLQRLSEALGRIEEMARAVKRRGIPVGEYFLAISSSGQVPVALVRASGDAKGRFVCEEQEIQRILEEEERRLGREVRVREEDANGAGDGATADVEVIPVYEHVELQAQVRVVADHGLDPRTWSLPAPDAPVVYRLRGDDGEEGVVERTTLQGVLDEIRKAGQRGAEIQRYKGLGEMNADELWATTMDPERRTILRVTLSDAGEADRLFSLLMGESVEPRRRFIEQHALEVTNLDI
jgi:DNA gyrase subunit B